MIFKPASEAEAGDMVRPAAAARRCFVIEGGGTRRGFGRPVQAHDTLSSRALSGITRYEPAELVFSAKAGTPLAEIEQALDANGHMLPFEPMDHRAIYNTTGEPTIGGVVATGASGPRRIQAGAARDLLLGLRFINGHGEIVQSGGRVMKNVTGLDLVKLQCGAHGTLGFLTEVTFKVLPKPERTATLVVEGLDDARAVAAMSAALGSPFSVSGAAHLPEGVYGEAARTLLRLENGAVSVTYRAGELTKALSSFGVVSLLDEDTSLALWRGLRDVEPLALPRGNMLWRISVAPTYAPVFVAHLREKLLRFSHFLDWGGGLIWLSCPPDADIGLIRATLGRDGHATLIRAADAMRVVIDVFQPQYAALMTLATGIKKSVDPNRLFNAGRMYAGH